MFQILTLEIADMKYNSKTDGLEEDTVANPIIYDSEKTFPKKVATTCHFSRIGLYIFPVHLICQP